MNNDYSRAIPETWRDISAIFAALGDEHRQRILLTFEAGERLNVGQIAEVSTLARSTVSHHLKVLREAGVLVSEREGKEIYFQVNKAFLQEAFAKVSAYLDAYL
ncbi:helix-turn-helix transcriptional regulator [Zoogloea sp.]|uniref:ArsR/SmtB family transcription factor n=1 Tax=Zoogloea sp. TaxID=49181 RepID=UPI0025F494C2|nr:metalloregulator ArsR/SmtB family transcription factor [Zoogloea sp.]MCK6396325.1 metalloregulator ArsR/SmtB family transcription factor [Zoogloea sp.]